MEIQFKKMSGAGNDFVVADNRERIVPESGRAELIERWCRRRVGIGADGVLLLEPAQGAGDFRMRYYNADGGEAESCGNGARCIARFALLVGAAPAEMRFETQAGIYEAVVGAEEVTISLSDPTDLRRNVKLPDVAGLPDGGRVDFINTGVPHVVVRMDDVQAVDPVAVGRPIRHHQAFAPAGANANFIAPRDEGGLAIRTYERGVEDETLACGTGAVASALVASLHGWATSPTPVKTRGGPVLTIHFERAGEGFRNIRLQGEARVVYEGTIRI